ncbi:hypothetical protein [Agarivorans sp. DSG3-1]|uniref:hypothetical protein n=1 Tax=Agarivorans sp. DSG3-1 TaxID=3342249 RepID=UPI00398E9916
MNKLKVITFSVVMVGLFTGCYSYSALAEQASENAATPAIAAQTTLSEPAGIAGDASSQADTTVTDSAVPLAKQNRDNSVTLTITVSNNNGQPILINKAEDGETANQPPNNSKSSGNAKTENQGDGSTLDNSILIESSGNIAKLTGDTNSASAVDTNKLSSINEVASLDTQQPILSCKKATASATKLSKWQTMLIQVGLYLEHHRYSDNKQAKQDFKYLSDGIGEGVTKNWLARYCEHLPVEQQSDVINTLYLSGSFQTLSTQCQKLLMTDYKVWGDKTFQQFLAMCISPSPTQPDNVSSDYYQFVACKDGEPQTHCIAPENYPASALSTLDEQDNYFATFGGLIAQLKSANTDFNDQQLTSLQSQTGRDFPAVLPEIPLFYSDCGCVHEEYFETHRYAYFPASRLLVEPTKEKEVADDALVLPPIIDLPYSDMSRIAFDRVVIEEDGSGTFNGWQEISRSFIREAHRHNTEVDVLLNFKQWRMAKATTLQKQMDSVKQYWLESSNTTLWDKLVSISSDVDGLNILFEDLYPHVQTSESWGNLAEQDAEAINQYISTLLTLTRANTGLAKKVELSLTLDLAACLIDSDCVEGYLPHFWNTLDVCPSIEAGSGQFERCPNGDIPLKFIMVTVSGNAAEDSNRLFNSYDKAFHGQTKGNLLIKTLPVVSPAILYQEELNSDPSTKPYSAPFKQAVYFGKYVLGGNAYWPLAKAHSSEIQALIYQSVHEDTTTPFARTLVLEAQQSTGVDICKYVCTGREIYRPAFMVYLLFMVFITVLRSESCVMCGVIERYFSVYIVMWLVLVAMFIAWLGCDELWNELQQEVLFIGFVGLALLCVLQLVNKREGPLP